MNEDHDNMLSQHVAPYLPDYVIDRLPGAQRAEVEAHLRECGVCQREYDAWRILASAVRDRDTGATPAMPFARAWSDLRARLPVGTPTEVSAFEGREFPELSDRGELFNGASTASSRVGPLHSHDVRHTSRHEMRWAVVVAALIALVVSSFAAIFYQIGGARRPTGVAISTPAPPSLRWEVVTAPVTPPGYAAADSFAVAPNDGNVVYACSIAQDTPNARPAIWRSGDRAQTWTRTADIPFTHSDIKLCLMTVDQIDSAIAVATIAWGKSNTIERIAAHDFNFVTFDAGVSWREIGFGKDESWASLATWGGKTYSTLGGGNLSRHMVMSEDQMKTGKEIAAPVPATEAFTVKLWMEPTRGQLLLEAGSQADYSEARLWISDDQGHTWRPAPGYTTPLAWMAIRPPRAGGSWSFCGVPSNGDSGATGLVALRLKIVCSFDGGVSWRQTNEAPSAAVSGSGGILGVAHDGSVLASIDDAKTKSTTFYWLPPGAKEWHTLESEPTYAGVTVVPAGAHDILWRTTVELTANGSVYHFATATH